MDWLEWLVTANFVVNNKIYLTTKMSPFIANYGRKLRMGVNIRKKRKSEENDRVCGKNEESAGESWGSIEESLGGDENISR